jgi:hypothetical protein
LEKEKNGEHPLGDAGQLILLGVFLVIWILDSFVLQQSTFLSEYIPLVIRLIILGAALSTALYFFKSGHVVIIHDQRPTEVVSSVLSCPAGSHYPVLQLYRRVRGEIAGSKIW